MPDLVADGVEKSVTAIWPCSIPLMPRDATGRLMKNPLRGLFSKVLAHAVMDAMMTALVAMPMAENARRLMANESLISDVSPRSAILKSLSMMKYPIPNKQPDKSEMNLGDVSWQRRPRTGIAE